MDDSLISVTESLPGNSRKRSRNPDAWKRSILRQKRYSSTKLPQYPKCNHNSKLFKCSLLNGSDIRLFHKSFYATSVKLTQDAFIVKYCKSTSVKTHKEKSRKKNINIKYHVRKCKSGNLLPVCQKTFLGILNLKQCRVKGVVTRFFLSEGLMPKETRGGDRFNVKFHCKREHVIKFIKTLNGSEPHYCRSKTIDRIYLPSDLNIRKLWRIYNNESPKELNVKQKYFRDIFNNKFNLSFKTPMTDQCSTCIEYKERIKNTTDAKEKHDLITLLRIHILKKRAFYSILRENQPEIMIMSFDCQKNLCLPKLPDQMAYFSRQWSFFYHFSIVTGNSRSSLSKNNVHSYTWNETQRPKGSNEIASAVFHRLTNTSMDISINTVRLVADGCGGQNKNTSLMCMIIKWFQSHAPPHIKRVEVIFPIVGHSFIPPDRVFGRIEKIIKSREVISDPNEYMSILKEHATVFDLGSEIPVFNWRQEAINHLRPPGSWHFRFNQAKRFFFFKTSTNKIKVQGEVNYRSELSTPQYITKKKLHSLSSIDPELIPVEKLKINKDKVKDVNNLLKKHYGEDWRRLDVLKFYSDIDRLSHSLENVESANEITLCEPRECDLQTSV